MAQTPYSHPLRVNRLNPRQPTELMLEPDAEDRARIAADLGLTDLPLARMTARIAASGQDGWTLTGRLTARVVQPCGITLAPVTTALDEDIERRWSPHIAPPSDEEAEVPVDDVEPLGQIIDAGEVLVEALALALPLYPRAPGAELDQTEGGDASDDDTRRPFAGLAALMAGRKEGAGGES